MIRFNQHIQNSGGEAAFLSREREVTGMPGENLRDFSGEER